MLKLKSVDTKITLCKQKQNKEDLKTPQAHLTPLNPHQNLLPSQITCLTSLKKGETFQFHSMLGFPSLDSSERSAAHFEAFLWANLASRLTSWKKYLRMLLTNKPMYAPSICLWFQFISWHTNLRGWFSLICPFFYKTRIICKLDAWHYYCWFVL